MANAKAPSSTMALVLGLLALLVCGVFAGIPAIIYGNRTMREVNESGGTLDGTVSGRFAQIVGWFTVIWIILVIPIVIITVLGR